MATEKSSAPHAHPATEDQDQGYPHACNDGWVTIGQIALDPETGVKSKGMAYLAIGLLVAGVTISLGVFVID